MENPFLSEGVLDTRASINKLIIGKMPRCPVKQDLTGREAITVFSTKLVIEEIKKHQGELRLDLSHVEEKMFPHYLEECLSSEDGGVRRTADGILKMFGERLAVILLCLKKGESENRSCRPEWGPEHWAYWGRTETIILVGGLANSYLGERLKYYAEKVFSDAREPGYRLILGNDSAYTGLRGCTNYLGKEEKEVVYLIFDFGQTFTKRSYVLRAENDSYQVNVLDNILSKHVEWDTPLGEPERREAHLLNESFLNIIMETIKEVEDRGLPIGEEMIISIANYVKDGRIVNRGGYGKLRLIADNYATYLEKTLKERENRFFKITLVHDGTAMAAGYSDYPNAICISLGTAFGVGFPHKAE